MLMKEFQNYQVRCRVCKEFKNKTLYKRGSFRICTPCRDSYYKTHGNKAA